MDNYKIIQVSATCRYAILDICDWPGGEKRKTEAEAVRFLLDQLFPQKDYVLSYYETGKPYLEGREEKISISHSHDKIAIITDQQKETGIDIELIRDKVLLIAHKFLSERERENLAANDVEKHLVYWAAKETLYKIYGRKKVDFIKNLYVSPFNYNADVGGIVNGRISLEEYNKTFMLHYEKLDNYILVYLI